MRRQDPSTSIAAGLTDRLRSLIADLPRSHIGRLAHASAETVRRCTLGQTPSLPLVAHLCDEFDVSIEWLVFGRGPRDRREVAVAALRGATRAQLEEELFARRSNPSAGQAGADAELSEISGGAGPSTPDHPPMPWGEAEVKIRRAHLMLGPADGCVIDIEPDPPAHVQVWVDHKTGVARRLAPGQSPGGPARAATYTHVAGNVYRWLERDIDARPKRPTARRGPG